MRLLLIRRCTGPRCLRHANLLAQSSARVDRVEVPVSVACVDPADVPAEPARVGGN
jgi:hypothetical protein